MRKILSLTAMLILLAGIFSPLHAQENAAKSVTGVEWMSSTQEAKLAYLLGASSIVAVDIEISKRMNKAPNKFTGGWMNTFDKMDLKSFAALIDDWYVSNPSRQDRYLLEVIYYEFIAPNNK